MLNRIGYELKSTHYESDGVNQPFRCSSTGLTTNTKKKTLHQTTFLNRFIQFLNVNL